MMLVVVNRSGLPRIGIPKEDKKILDHYRDGRSALEHRDERLHGGKRANRMKDAPWDQGNLGPAGSSPSGYESPNSLSAHSGQNVSASPSWAR
jgi:hypothetical protein